MTPEELLESYILAGWIPIPIPFRSKNPGFSGWNRWSIEDIDPDLHFPSGRPWNVGIVLGAPSQNLVDIDLDCLEIAPFLDLLLPRTCTFGRASNPRSHWLYVCETATAQLRDPIKNDMLVEIRSTGAQTVFPPSVHVDGEDITWTSRDADIAPPTILADDLLRRVRRAAAGVLLGRYWPEHGRHEAQLALAGVLLQLRFTEEDALEFLCLVCRLAGEEDRGKRISTITHTAQQIHAGERVKSFGTLAKILEPAAWLQIRDWLGEAPTEPIADKDFPVMSASEIFAPLPPVDWIVQGIDLAPGPPMLIAGAGYAGKTLSSYALALDLARPAGAFRHVWGRFPAGAQRRVLIWDHEQGRRCTLDKIQRLARGSQISAEELKDTLHVVSLPNFYLDVKGSEEQALRLFDGYGLVVIDSLSAVIPHTEENSTEAAASLHMLIRVCEKIGCMFVILHHASKPSEDREGNPQHAIRGSTAIFNACGSVLFLVGGKKKGDPTLVRQLKARVSGQGCDEFLLEIKDENTGVVVRARDIPSDEEVKGKSSEEVRAACLQALRMYTGVNGASRLCDIMHPLPSKDVKRAFYALEQEGLIINVGSERSKDYRSK